MFEFDKDFMKKDEDTFHFVAYVPVNGRLYELDGLKEGPVDLGKCQEGQDWLKSVKPILDKRIQRLGKRGLGFQWKLLVSHGLSHWIL